MTGKAPAPVPITRRRHFQGSFSSMESGVCPNSPRNCLEGFFLRLRTCPRSITTSWLYVAPSIRIDPNAKCSNRISASLEVYRPQLRRIGALHLNRERYGEEHSSQGLQKSGTGHHCCKFSHQKATLPGRFVASSMRLIARDADRSSLRLLSGST